jgi:hypothetical protein
MRSPLEHEVESAPDETAPAQCSHGRRRLALISDGNRSQVGGDKRIEAHGASKIPPGCFGLIDEWH